MPSGWSLIPGAEIDLPVHGQIGSKRASVVLDLAIARTIATRWSALTDFAVGRDGDREDDVSRYNRKLTAELSYKFPETLGPKFIWHVDRSWQSGKAAGTTVSIEGDLPLDAKWTGILTIARSRSDTSSNSIEFDLSYSY